MRLSVIRYSALALLAVVGLASRSDAGPIIVVPPTLSPGDTYRLVFVTSTTRDATSTDIVDYNNFVSTAANSVSALAALGATWTAIGSTAAVSAFDNIGGPFPEGVYRLDGGLVATGSTGLFFSNPSDAHLLPIDINELGATVPDPTTVWTGTLPSGTVNSPFPLGGSVQATWGLALPSAPVGWVFQFFSPVGTSMPLYAISSPLTVPAGGEVPEPGTIGMTALGGALLFLARRRKQQKSQGACTRRTTPAHH